MKTLENEFKQKKCFAYYYFDCIEELENVIDSFINKIKILQKDISGRSCGELFSFLLGVVFEIDTINNVVERYSTMTSNQLLQSTNRKYTYDIIRKLEDFNSKLREGEDLYSLLKNTAKYEELRLLNKYLLKNYSTIFSSAHYLSSNLIYNIFTIQSNLNSYKAEEINSSWNDLIRRYEKENADIYEEYFLNVIDVQESLKLLREERNNNEYIASWQNIHVPAKYIAKLRAQEKATEQDLLPVFDYEIKYTKLKEMYKEQQQRSSSLQQQQHQTQHIDLQDISNAIKENAGTHFSGSSQQNNFISTEALNKMLTSTQKTSQNLIE